MLTAEQIIERRNYLGSTDAPGVLGLSRWTTPLKVWCEKTGVLEPEDISDKLQVKLGNKMETILAELFEEETGKKLHRVNETKFHKYYRYLAANLDRRIVGENTIVELKTASAWKSKEWQGDEIPQEYIVQVYHQLAVTGYKKAYLCVLIGNHDLQIKEIVRDEKLLDDLLRREVAFWNLFVLTKTMPSVVTKHDTDTLDRLYPRAVEGKEITLADDANVLIENLNGYRADMKVLEGLQEAAENELKKMLGDAVRGTTSLNTVQWINSQSSRLDGKALLEKHPQIHAEFYKSKPTRRFSYKKNGGQ